MKDEDPLNLDGVPLGELGAVLSEQFNALDKAFEEADDGERVFAYVAYLSQIARALRKLPGFNARTLALQDLVTRLERLSVGQKKPIMSVIDGIKIPHRAPDSFTDQIIQARAVALLQHLLSMGWSEKESAKLIADELGRAGVRGRQGKHLSARTVSEWADKVMQNDEAYTSTAALLKEFVPESITRHDLKGLVRKLMSEGFGMLR